MEDSRKTGRMDPQFRAIAWLKVPTSDRVVRLAQPSMRAYPVPGAKNIDIRREEIPGKDGNRIPALVFTPKGESAPRPCLVYFHGGGFLFPAAPYHFELAKQYALEAECTVVFPDYRLAPEYRYPAQLDDCVAVYEWVLGHPGRLKIDPDRIAVGGDSAGGTLAAAVTLVLRDRQMPLPCFQMLLYPALDWRMRMRSAVNSLKTPILTSRDVKEIWKIYLPALPQEHPEYASPMEAGSLCGLPPAYLELADLDPLHDEGLAYGEKLRQDGVKTVINQTVGTPHGFDLAMNRGIARRAAAARCRALRSAFYSGKEYTMNTAQQFTAKEWNVSGAFHFYGSTKPRSFLVEVSASDPIDGALLQQAVDKTVKRMPYYLQTFVRKKGLYYYADNDLPLLVAESESPRVIGDAATNYHMLDVTYSGTWIRFAMFHGLCDGLGLNRFIEATLYHYFCAKDGKEYSDEGIITDRIPFDPEETADGFIRDEQVDTKELKKLANSEVRVRLPELETGKGPLMYRYPVRIKTDALLGWSKSVSASPATAISAILGQSIHRELPDAEGVIMAVVPISLRKYLQVDKSFKNCASAVFLPMKPEECDSMTAGELAAKLRGDLKGQMSEEWALLLTQSIRFLTQLGKKLPFYFLKNKVMAIAENRPQDTVTVDYVGGLKTNDYSDRITEVRYLNPDVYHGSMYAVISETAGYFHINFNQTFDSRRYFNAFLKGLDELQIPYEALPGDTYLNPVVELPQEQR